MSKRWKFYFVGYLPVEVTAIVAEGDDHDGRRVEDEFEARDAAWDAILDGNFDPKIENWTTERMDEYEV